jgi:hypothetical protein
MKRLTLLLSGLVLAVTATAHAQGLTMQMSNGWAFSFSGNVNAFAVYSKVSNNGPGNFNIRTGLLPGFATFEARGKEAGMNLGIHVGFAPQIQNGGGVHDLFGSQIDMRQLYLTVGFKDGSSLLAGRELGVFGRQNILNDMTLYGVGAIGIGNQQGSGITLGRIGYGYIYPNFNAQVTYSTKPGQTQFTVGAFQPSVLPGYGITTVPRFEAEFTYNQKSGGTRYMVWVGGLWQTATNLPTGGTSVSSVGGTAGIKADVSQFTVVVSGYFGKGLGTVFMFSGIGGGPIAGNGTATRPSDGGYAQVMYNVDPKTNVGLSWGFSRLKNDQTGDGNTGVRANWFSYTAGVYHQWTKSLKLVVEGTREQEGNGAGKPAMINVSAGLMLFF